MMVNKWPEEEEPGKQVMSGCLGASLTVGNPPDACGLDSCLKRSSCSHTRSHSWAGHGSEPSKGSLKARITFGMDKKMFLFHFHPLAFSLVLNPFSFTHRINYSLLYFVIN